MLHKIQDKVGWRRYKIAVAIALPLIALGVILYTGFASDMALALFYRLPSGGGFGAAPIYHGPVSLEERILEADVIARVRLLSVSPGAEAEISQVHPDPDTRSEWVEEKAYLTAIEFEFEVLEYLKGGGGGRVTVIATHSWMAYKSELGARAFSHDVTDTRDSTWDDREAIVFLKKSVVYPEEYPQIPSLERPDRYFIGRVSGSGGDFKHHYTLNSRGFKRWLPAAGVGEAVSQASVDGSAHGTRSFLTGAARAEGEDFEELIDYRVADNAYNEALGAGGDSSTITLSRLKDIIDELEAEVAAGNGSEEYRECVYEKYKWNREAEYHAYRGGYDTETHDHELVSGSPADTVFANGTYPFQPPDDYDPVNHEYANPHGEWEGWIEGRDAHLFHVANNKSIIATKRPIPAGEYRFYFNDRDSKYIPCDAYPESLRTWKELVVDASAPTGTLHEAFFDPVDIGDTLGADGDSGVLQPDSFESEEGEIVMERIAWQEGQVEMELSPATDLSDYRLDFIALDGSVALRLDFDDAVETVGDDDVATLAWGVCVQPWVDGDLLMLRTAEGVPDDGVAAVNDEECLAALPEHIFEPAAVPTPEPAPDPTATPEPTETSESVETATPEPEPTAETTTEPERTPDPTATIEPEPEPTDTPEPESTAQPTPEPEPEPTDTPEPTPESTPQPTATPITDACLTGITSDGAANGIWSSACTTDRDLASANAPVGTRYASYYTFVLSQQSEVTITLDSSEDTYLFLLSGYGRNGGVIEQNDDIDTDAQNHNSRVVATLASGEYTILATTYNLATAGDFTLTVSGIQ
ncbi:MAG: procyclic acidic repetitive family protein [Chloroflexota bacterium]|nr:procyclic acidic repetitive family protein [Chloroflexota bacterium]